MIVVVDRVLPQTECDFVISLYAEYQKDAHDWNGTKPLNLNFVPKKSIAAVVNKILHFVRATFPDAEYDWGEIVKWHTGNYQNLHLDRSCDTTILTSITYLNDSFEGGETYFEDGSFVKPITGRTLIFNGIQYLHGVKEVTNGSRWTVPIWYKKSA